MAPARRPDQPKPNRHALNATWREEGLDVDQRARRFRPPPAAGGLGTGGLESYRLANDRSQTDVAVAYTDRHGGGVTNQNVSQWERWPGGRNPIRPSLVVLEHLAALYHTTVLNLVAAIYENQPGANVEDGWSSPSPAGRPGEVIGTAGRRENQYVAPGEVRIPAHVPDVLCG